MTSGRIGCRRRTLCRTSGSQHDNGRQHARDGSRAMSTSPTHPSRDSHIGAVPGSVFFRIEGLIRASREMVAPVGRTRSSCRQHNNYDGRPTCREEPPRVFGPGALLAAPSVSWAQSPPAGEADDRAPDLIAINARVLTMDGRQPRAKRSRCSDGRFIAVGSTEDSSHARDVTHAGRRLRTDDSDARLHRRALPSGRKQELYDVNADRRRIAEIQHALRARAAQTPPDHWVDAFKFDDTKLTERRALDATTSMQRCRIIPRASLIEAVTPPGRTARLSSLRA